MKKESNIRRDCVLCEFPTKLGQPLIITFLPDFADGKKVVRGHLACFVKEPLQNLKIFQGEPP